MDSPCNDKVSTETSYILHRYEVSSFINATKKPEAEKSRLKSYHSTDWDNSTGLQYSLPEISQLRGFGHSPWSLKTVEVWPLVTQSNIAGTPVVEETSRLLADLSKCDNSFPTNNASCPEQNQDLRYSIHTSKFLTVLDTAIAFLWVGPLVSAYWYNTWTLCDRYFFSNNLEVSYWFSATIGCIFITVATLLQKKILTFSSNRRKFVRLILMRIFSYVMSIANINQWRGVWDLEDYYTGISLLSALISYGLATLVLLPLRGQRSVLTAPTTISVDMNHPLHYKMTTFCSVSPRLSLYFLLDTAFTVFVFEPITITVWRGLWELADQLYPQDKQSRAIWCLVGSYALAFLLAILQVPIRRFTAWLKQISWYLMLAFEDIILVLYGVFTIISWRGIWLVLELYTPQGTGFIWIYHYLSFGLLVLTLCANSAVTQVGVMDGSIENGKGATLELLYLRNIWGCWQREKDINMAVKRKLITTESEQLPRHS